MKIMSLQLTEPAGQIATGYLVDKTHICVYKRHCKRYYTYTGNIVMKFFWDKDVIKKDGEIYEKETGKKYFFTNRDLGLLFLPLIIEQGLNLMVGLADSLMVAQLGESAVSGVSLVDFLMAFLINIFAALGTGGTVVAGQYIGHGSRSMAVRCARQLMRFALWFSFLIMAAIYLMKPFILGVLFGSITDEVRTAADIYFMITVASIPFIALYNCEAAVFRTMGNSKLPMLIMLSMNILNVAGNAVCVFVLDMGVAGIAWPTLISRAGAALIIIYLGTRKNLTLSISGWMRERGERQILSQILKVGAPYGLENGLFHLGRLLVVSIVALFGTASIAANSVAGIIVLFEVLPGTAVNLGLSVVIAQCVGADDYRQAKYYTKKILGLMHISLVASTALMLALMPLLMKLYALSPEAQKMVWMVVISHGVLEIIMWPEAFSLPVVFRGAGDARYPMYTSMAVMIFIRVAGGYIAGKTLGFGMMGTWAVLYIDWVFRTAIYVYRYLKGKWMGFRIIN